MKLMMRDVSKTLTTDEIREYEASEKMPLVEDEDCPIMTEAQLKQFHRFDEIMMISNSNF